MIHVSGVDKVFPGRKGKAPVTALDGLSVDVGDSEFVTIVGASGCGKSTLLSIVAGLQDATAGTVEVDGAPVTGPGRDRGVVFQTYTLFPWLSALGNVEFALKDEPIGRDERRRRAMEQLELVGLRDFADAYPAELSGGMRQRVALARALVYRPRTLLMDEPFGALDALTRRVMQELLTQVWEQHRLTVLFITHDVEEAVFVSDRVLVMTNRPGRIKEEIRVDLPRPRSYELVTTPEFRALYERVLTSIREEALAVVNQLGGE